MLCTKCHRKMQLVNSNETVDKIIWRCRGSSPKHDVKIGIKKGSYLNLMDKRNFI